VRRGAALLVALVGCGGAAQRVPQPPPVAEIPVLRAARPGPPSLGPAPGKAPSGAVQPTVPPAIEACPADMAAVASFCIDRYEAPNEKGEIPYALQTAYDGEVWCKARGKRLCTEDEWARACAGPDGRAYPYGDDYRPHVCNDDKGWLEVSWKALAKWPQDAALDEAAHLFDGDMSGARAECVSAEGVYDLTGNVAEWVRRSGPPPHPGYDHVLKGCYWAGCYHNPRPNCTFHNGAHPGTFRTYEAGFRCCKPRATAGN
jgi:sulfatase modifying factor 1